MANFEKTHGYIITPRLLDPSVDASEIYYFDNVTDKEVEAIAYEIKETKRLKKFVLVKLFSMCIEYPFMRMLDKKSSKAILSNIKLFWNFFRNRIKLAEFKRKCDM
jgi:hypothetical protein